MDSLEQRLSECSPTYGMDPLEARSLIQLMRLMAHLPPPPDPFGLFPRYGLLRQSFLEAIEMGDWKGIEGSFLALYSHLHCYRPPYTVKERASVLASGGYLCHAGGLSPVLKAGPHLDTDSVSLDLGAGNGLQGLFLQFLYPHRRSIQVEISARLLEAGRLLGSWMGLPDAAMEWVCADLLEVVIPRAHFVYLYRPLRPEGPGLSFYKRLAHSLRNSPVGTVVFSVADCLSPHLPSSFKLFYDDGHLCCFRNE